MSLQRTRRRQITFCVQLRPKFLLQVARHVSATNCFVCTGQFLWKSFSQQQNFGAATSRTNLVGLSLCDLLQRQNFLAETKLFTIILQYCTREAIYRCVRRDVSTCCLECSHLKSYLQASTGTDECADRHWWITDKGTGRQNKTNRGQSTSLS